MPPAWERLVGVMCDGHLNLKEDWICSAGHLPVPRGAGLELDVYGVYVPCYAASILDHAERTVMDWGLRHRAGRLAVDMSNTSATWPLEA